MYMTQQDENAPKRKRPKKSTPKQSEKNLPEETEKENSKKESPQSKKVKDEYKKKMENQPWTFLAENGDVPREHSLLIRDLQQAHDTFEVIKWDRRLEGVAKEHKLTFTKP